MGINAADYCLDQTKESIRIKLRRLLGIAISEQLHPFISKISAEQEGLQQQAAKILAIHPDLLKVLTLKTVYERGSASVRWGAFASQVDFQHPPVYNPVEVSLPRDRIFTTAGTATGFSELPSEEVENAANHCAVFEGEIHKWLCQFYNQEGNIDELALSRICSISPTFRACLVNNGSQYPKRNPAVITVFKQGPRLSNDFKPMSLQLSLALQIAANMENPE